MKLRHFFYLVVTLFLIFGTSCEDKKTNDKVYYFENRSTSDVHTPIIRLNLNGVEKYWIIDTGANMSLIDNDFYENNKTCFDYITSLDMTLNGVSGSKNYNAHYISAELGDSVVIMHQFLTSDLSSVRKNIKNRLNIDIVGIIGSDYLDKYSYTVDFYNRTLYRHEIKIDSLFNIKK